MVDANVAGQALVRALDAKPGINRRGQTLTLVFDSGSLRVPARGS